MRQRILQLVGLIGDALARHRILRMFVAGGVNTVFGFVVFAVFLEWAKLPMPAALLLSLVCGTLFNFLTTGHYVFRQLSARKYPRFLVSYLAVYLVNLGLVKTLHTATGNDILSQAILSLPVALLSYWLMGKFVFNGQNMDSGEERTA